jgi:hypothetical protein
MKKIILLIAVGVALTTQTLFAQVPSYVPTNGLVGYWPFNGNANDESGNGNNGTNNGAALTTDRLGDVNSAYNFNGNNNFIQINNPTLTQGNSSRTISAWVNLTPTTGYDDWYSIVSYGNNIGYGFLNDVLIQKTLADINFHEFDCISNPVVDLSNNWHNITITYDSSNLLNIKIYLDSLLLQSNISNFQGITSLNTQLTNLYFGKSSVAYTNNNFYFFNGKIDDIGIWNRALTQQEIANLYNSLSSNECLTMVINTGALSTTPVTYSSSVSIYPNPANDQITIDCGNLANVVGWNIKITNMLGQEVFNQPMNTQQYVVPLNTWTGQGMYFVKIINAQNEVVNIKKIILQ